MVQEGGDKDAVPVIWKELPGDFDTTSSSQQLSYHCNLEGLKTVIVKVLWFTSFPLLLSFKAYHLFVYGCFWKIDNDLS